jgi:hypothetical protein
MTRRDIEELAYAFRWTRPDPNDADALRQWCQDLDNITRVCRERYPRFNEAQFRAWAEQA